MYRFLRYPQGKYKALTLSYDDGTCHDKKLIEIANRYGISVTLNINSGWIAKEDGQFRLSAREISDILASGNHEIAVHGSEHLALGTATSAAGIRDVFEGRKTIEAQLDKIVRGYAYACSGIRLITENISKQEIKSYLKMLGIAYARSLGGDNDEFKLPEDFYEWVPTAHHANANLMNYLDRFVSLEIPEKTIAFRSPKLFYLWGHSYEFNDNNNWERFEEFCQKAGGHDDIWYATNIELCDYVRAYQSLIFNTELTTVYNPTDKEIWFDLGRRLLSVKPGETISTKK